MDATLILAIIAALVAIAKSKAGQTAITGVSTVTKQIGKAAAFIAKEYPNAKQVEAQYGISPLITLIQAAHESDFGTSHVYSLTHNLYGINASDAWIKAGKPTYTNPALQAQFQNFRKYPDDLSCMLDWAEFIKTRYPLSFQAARAADLDLFLDGLAKGIYGAYAGPTDGSAIPKYKKDVLALLPSVTGSLPSGVA